MAEDWEAVWAWWRSWAVQQAPALWLVVVALALVVTIVGMVLVARVRRAERHYRTLVGEGEADVMAALEGYVGRVSQMEIGLAKLRADLDRLSAKVGYGLRYVGVVRYNAFADVAGDLSFAVALLDDHDSGLVLNGIVGRDSARTYLKRLRGGQGSAVLTEEERQAIEQARQERKQVLGNGG